MKKNIQSQESGAKWLGTFNDMVTLLLTFFVLVLSMSTLDKGKVQEAAYALSGAFGMLRPGERSGVKVFTPFVQPLGKQNYVFEELRDKVASDINKIDNIMAEATRSGVIVTLGERVLFDTGCADINVNSHVLKALTGILTKTDCHIQVEGHTDDVPIHNKQFQSNWELSVKRAVNLVKYFVGTGEITPKRLSATGYGDSRPRVTNYDDESRAANRRVEIVLTFSDK